MPKHQKQNKKERNKEEAGSHSYISVAFDFDCGGVLVQLRHEVNHLVQLDEHTRIVRVVAVLLFFAAWRILEDFFVVERTRFALSHVIGVRGSVYALNHVILVDFVAVFFNFKQDTQIRSDLVGHLVKLSALSYLFNNFFRKLRIYPDSIYSFSVKNYHQRTNFSTFLAFFLIFFNYVFILK